MARRAAVLAAAALLLGGCGSDDDGGGGASSPPATGPATTSTPGGGTPRAGDVTLSRARAAVRRHRDELLRRPGVVGFGVGKRSRNPDPRGRHRDYEIHVFLREARYRTGLPRSLDGVPVRPVVTGIVTAQ